MKTLVGQTTLNQQLFREIAARRGITVPVPQNRASSTEAILIGNDDEEETYPCAMCPALGLMPAKEYVLHLILQHQGAREVCAICASKPNGNPNFRSENLGAHAETRHLSTAGLYDEDEATRLAIERSLHPD